MRASAFFEFGPPDVLRVVDLPLPSPAADEVLVRVAASTVNPTDIMMRAGLQAPMMEGLAPPFVCGNEFSGHIAKVGADVSRLAEGAAVMGAVSPRRQLGGSHAEYVCVPAASVVAIADDVDLHEAATVPMNGLTAKLALTTLGLNKGETLLVTGGGGALGSYIIELAHASGLHVVADAKAEDADLLLALGADDVVPRGDAMGASIRGLYPRGVNGLVDCALLGEAAAALVRDGGAAVSVRSSNPIRDPRLRAQHISVGAQLTNTPALEDLAAAWARGRLTPRVHSVWTMQKAAEAHRLVEKGGLRGRVVLAFDG